MSEEGGSMTPTQDDEVRTTVRNQYGKVAEQGGSCGCAPGCCGPAAGASESVGYSPGDLLGTPVGADMGLGCGNPQAIVALRPGETVLDLGSGGGLDCFLAAKQVGASGRVIGVDMTPEMVARARANARGAFGETVEFRLGEIEHLPVGDASVDVILSNCVINLSPDKEAVFRDAFRVLKPGGRLAVSDIVETAPMPESLRQRTGALTGCVARAASVETLREILLAAGFEDVRIEVNPASRDFIRDWMPGLGAEDYVAAATIEARRPKRG